MTRARGARGVALAWLAVAATAGAQSATLVLRWKEVAGASAYELQIARDPAFAEVVLQTRAASTAYRWAELPAATHWWRVRSVDAEGRPSEWSAARTVGVDVVVPDVLRPAEGAVLPCGSPVEVEVRRSPLVTEYLLEVSASPSFPAPRLLRQTQPVFALGALGSGTWSVRASAVDLHGRRAGPGPARTLVVRLTAPRARPPADAVVGSPQVVLGWSSVACARSYLVEVVTDAVERVTLPASEPLLAVKPSVAGDHRFRVAGVDEAGVSGEWSAEASFRVKLATPVPRPEVLLDDRAELAWAAVPGATSYRVELAPTGPPPTPGGPLVVAGSPFRTAALAPGAYAWRVQARDGAGHTSALSELRVFELQAPAPLQPPAFAPRAMVVAVNAELELAWSPVPEAQRYQVELDGELLPAVSSLAARTAPLAEGWHRVRVRALAAPRASPWSESGEVFAGVPPVEALVVAREGELVRVRLLDRLGHLVEATAPRFHVARGELEVAELREGWWVMRWRPPSSGADVLEVTERGFHEERPLIAEALAPAWVAVQVGARLTGAGLASPSMGLGVGLRLPVLLRRLALELKAAVSAASAGLVVGGVSWRAEAALVPLSLLVEWHQPIGPLLLRGAVGPTALLAATRVNDAARVQVAPGLELAASASVPLGPGRVELEVGYLAATLDATLARLDAGGAWVRLGYAGELGGR